MSEGQMLQPGGRLGPYEIVALLGAGGMGEVWRARDPRLDRQVALKVLPAEVAADPERLARFEREAKALAALSHPHIVTIYSVEEAEGVRFLTMELVEGETLERSIPTGGMALERFLEVAVALAEALAAAHAQGVLHRDLKPGNVMVTPEGRVKVLDFGLAKLAREPVEDLMEVPTETLEALTREGRIVGTVPYMAPEQLQGRAVDARSDLFSLGVMLYQMATGRRPFQGESSVEVLSSILRDDPASVTDLRPEMPRQLGRILRHCLAKDPERRFQSAKDLRNDLEALREEVTESSVAEKIDDRRRRQGASDDDAGQPAISASMRRLRLALPVVLAVPLILAALLWLRAGDESPSPTHPAESTEPSYPRTALAVLPFQNLSVDPADAFFAGGLHDELLTQLSRVAALSPRGRTSVMGYAGTTKPLRQIAEELEVGALVEGSVQVVAGRLRVGVRLLDVATAEPLWAERYDRPLDDAFAIQSEVALRVVAAVGAALASDVQRAVVQAPTANAEAYQLYLQGREYFRRPGWLRQNWESAQQLYERALELDPQFALAHAALSEVHGRMHWFRYDTSPARVQAQREAAEEAARLAPDEPHTHLAMGQWHYNGQREWQAALAEYEIALRGLPNDARLAEQIGFTHRRMGNWDEVESAFKRAVELDPRNAKFFDDLGGRTHRFLRRYPDAMRAFDHALVLAPDFHGAAAAKGWVYVLWQGRLDAARSVFDAIPGDAYVGASRDRAELLLFERDAIGLLEHVDSIEPDVLEGQLFFLPKSLYAAWAHRLSGDPEAAQRAFAGAHERLDTVPHYLEEDWRLRAARGFAAAGLGDREAALHEALWLKRSAVYREDALWGTWLARDRAQILAQVGEAEAALDEIERLLSGASEVSVHTLRLDPRFDPIRDHPRFQELLVRYAEP